MSSDKIGLYDVSKKMREVLEWKDARRKVLREQYLRQAHHPKNQQAVMDDAIQRVYLYKYTQEYYAKATGKAQMVFYGITIGVIWAYFSLFHTPKQESEAQLRSGYVSYADRKFKFQ